MALPLYQTIYNDLKSQINDGTYKINDKIPTEFEIVEIYEVSRITAIRALNMLADDGLIERIPRVGSIVLEKKKNNNNNALPPKTIPVILPISTEDVPRLLSSIQQAAMKNGYLSTPIDTHQDIASEREVLKTVANMDIEGIICYPMDGYDNVSYYNAIKQAGIPILSIDKKVPIVDIPCVTTHNSSSMYRMTKWLIEKGHTNIAYCCASLRSINDRYRFQGYIQALNEYGLIYDSKTMGEIYRSRPLPYMVEDDVTKMTVRKYLSNLMALENPPTALVCAFDVLATHVVQQAKVLDIDIPTTLSVTGFDNLSMTSLMDIPITTMEQDFSSIGAKAFDVLMKLVNKEPVDQLYLFDAKMIERKSVFNRKKDDSKKQHSKT